MHIYDIYNVLDGAGYNDNNLTEGEVRIPLAAIEELVKKRAVKANLEPAPESYVSIKNPIGEQVLEPLDGSDESAWEIISGGRTVTDERGFSWDVGRDGRITRPTPYAGYPDFGLGGKVAKTIRSVYQLNKLVKTGKVPKSIIRFDKGKIYGELDHVHFDNGSALNINGTWKHGSKSLTNSEIKFLQENGWKIPN